MSATNVFETSLLELIFNATPISNIADDAASSPATSLYVSLHTADPGETGNQETSEADFTDYARVAVTRDSSGWTISNDVASNAGTVTFPTCTGGSNVVTHVGIGLGSTGTGTLLYKGVLDSPITVSNGITVAFLIGELTVSLT